MISVTKRLEEFGMGRFDSVRVSVEDWHGHITVEAVDDDDKTVFGPMQFDLKSNRYANDLAAVMVKVAAAVKDAAKADGGHATVVVRAR